MKPWKSNDCSSLVTRVRKPFQQELATIERSIKFQLMELFHHFCGSMFSFWSHVVGLLAVVGRRRRAKGHHGQTMDSMMYPWQLRLRQGYGRSHLWEKSSVACRTAFSSCSRPVNSELDLPVMSAGFPSQVCLSVPV